MIRLESRMKKRIISFGIIISMISVFAVYLITVKADDIIDTNGEEVIEESTEKVTDSEVSNDDTDEEALLSNSRSRELRGMSGSETDDGAGEENRNIETIIVIINLILFIICKGETRCNLGGIPVPIGAFCCYVITKMKNYTRVKSCKNGLGHFENYSAIIEII